MRPSIIILTFNSEATIGATLQSVEAISDDIHIVDSFSSDMTLEIVRRFGARLIQRPFTTYAEQRNWAIENLPIQYSWQLHLDADERLSKGLIEEIRKLPDSPEIDGFLIPRLTYFLGHAIRHGGHYPVFHMRLFRNGAAIVENKLYDQHFILHGVSQRLRNPMIDDIRLTLREWTERHNRWADLEAENVTAGSPAGQTVAATIRDPIGRRRAFRDLYYRLPLGLRPFLLFIYR